MRMSSKSSSSSWMTSKYLHDWLQGQLCRRIQSLPFRWLWSQLWGWIFFQCHQWYHLHPDTIVVILSGKKFLLTVDIKVNLKVICMNDFKVIPVDNFKVIYGKSLKSSMRMTFKSNMRIFSFQLPLMMRQVSQHHCHHRLQLKKILPHDWLQSQPQSHP